MLPATLAGLHRQEVLNIPLEPLCRDAGVDFVQANVDKIDTMSRQIITDKNRIAYDFAVISIGSDTVDPQALAKAKHVVAVRPMPNFVERFGSAIESNGQSRFQAFPFPRL
ncbi:hypothetical protein [Stratiformator vulcanicus]|nr:hypothetical protein [Stratiformator vulcanicus]